MKQWTFIVQIVLAVQLTCANPANAIPAEISPFIAQNPWESGLTAAVDALANGVSLFGKLAFTGLSDLGYSVFHGAGMLASGTLGNHMVNINTRHFSDMFAPDSANPFAAPGSDSKKTPSQPTAASRSPTPVSQSPGTGSQTATNPP